MLREIRKFVNPASQLPQPTVILSKLISGVNVNALEDREEEDGDGGNKKRRER